MTEKTRIQRLENALWAKRSRYVLLSEHVRKNIGYVVDHIDSKTWSSAETTLRGFADTCKELKELAADMSQMQLDLEKARSEQTELNLTSITT